MQAALAPHSLDSFDSFEAVALPHLNDLFRAARHTLGDAAEAEDIVQETYLQAWKSFHRFEVGTNIRGWLFKIMFHVMDHHRRKWLRLKWKSDSDEILMETLTYEPETPPHLTDEEVLAALNKLPRNFRVVVLLADVEEFAYKEIAEMLNVPIGTVMSRLNRGRKLLRTELADYAVACGISQQPRAAAAHGS